MPRRAALLLFLAASVPPALSQQGMPRPQYGPRPGWVDPIEQGEPEGSDDHSGGVEYLCVDDQVLVTGDGAEHWSLRSRRITSLQGVDSESQFQLDWDPSYETLTIHRLVVLRDGKELDRLDPSAVDVVRREPAFEASLLDGTLSALIVIPDVRVGDVLEHEYSIAGRNPIFAGHWFGGFGVNWGVVVRRLGFRLSWPGSREMHWQAEGIDAEPTLEQAGSRREARWLFEDTEIVEFEGDEPPWFDPGGGVSISEFASWAEVAEWAAPLYEAPEASGDVAALVERLGEAGSPEDQALAAIRFVQDEVRYLGLEIGTGTHRPSPPATVLERRFGDCKDKVLLLITILRGLGIEADAGLVSTTWLSELESRLPSPGAFDHVIVRMRLGGSEYWVDPTISAQRGRLEARHVPRLGKALIVKAGAGELVDVIPASLDSPRTEVHARYVLPTVGGPATMTVKTSYSGRDADDVRASLSGESREQTERSYRNYYGRIHPGLESVRKLIVRDDEENNVLSTEEAYRIPSPWTLSEDGTTWTAAFRASEIEPLLIEPERSERESPLAIDHPRHVIHRITLELPADWDVATGVMEVEGPAATFTRTVTAEMRRIDVVSEWRTHVDWIPAGEAPRHVSVVRRSFDLATLEVTAAASGKPLTALAGAAPRGFNWAALALVLVTALASAGLGLTLLFAPTREAAPPPISTGFLLAAGLALLLPLLLGLQLAMTVPSFAFEPWIAFTMPGSPAYEPAAAPFLLLALVLSVAAFVLSAWLPPLLLLRRRAFRILLGLILAGMALLAIVHFAGGILVPGAFPRAPGLGLASLLAIACLGGAAGVAISRSLREMFPR